MLSGKLRAATGGEVGESWTFAESLSKNLTTWGPGGASVVFPYYPEYSGSYGSELGVIGNEGGLSTTSDAGATWSYWPNTPVDQNYRAVGTNGSDWIIGQFSGNGLWYSTDKITWTNYYANLIAAGWTSGINISGILWDGTNWIIMGGNGLIAKGPNMTTWTVSTSLRSIYNSRFVSFDNIIYANGLYVACGDKRSNSGAIICTSPDGLTWTERVYAINFGIQNVVWTGLQFVAIDYVGLVYTSTTGITWVSNTGLQTVAYVSPSAQYANLRFDGAKLIAILRDGAIATSTNGTTWSLNNALKTNITWNTDISTLALYIGSKFLVFGVKNSRPLITAESTDLTTWVFPEIFTQFTTTYGRRDPNDILWTGSQYILLSQLGGNVATSPNGINWTNQLGLYNNATYNDGSPGTANINSSTYGANKVAIIRSGLVPRKMFTTSDGVTWTYQPTFDSTYVSNGPNTSDGLYFAGNKFYISFDNNTYGVSLDAITWTAPQPAIWVGFYITNVIWSGSIYLAFGSGNRSATSPDGLTWTNQPNTVTNSIQGINNYGFTFWDGSQFVASSGGLIWTSPTGVTWTSNSGLANAITTLNKGTLATLTWCGTFCIAITNQAAVLKSYNYTTWTSSLDLQSTDWYKYFTNNWAPTAGAWSGAQLAICAPYGKLAVSA